MAEISRGVPLALRKIIDKAEFWGNPPSGTGANLARGDLPLRESGNRTLLIRMVAHAAIGSAQKDDWELLGRLTMHHYRMVARAAALRMIAVAGAEAIGLLQSLISRAIETGSASSLAAAVRDAEIQQYQLANLW